MGGGRSREIEFKSSLSECSTLARRAQGPGFQSLTHGRKNKTYYLGPWCPKGAATASERSPAGKRAQCPLIFDAIWGRGLEGGGIKRLKE